MQRSQPFNNPYSSTSNGTNNQHYSPKVEANMHMAVRDAAAVAIASIEKKLTSTSTAHETVYLTRQLTELQRCSMQSKLGFLNALMKMNTRDEKLHTLFMLFDKNGRGTVDRIDLTRSLKRLVNQVAKGGGSSILFSSSISDSSSNFNFNDNNMQKSSPFLDIHGFSDLLDQWSGNMKCSFDDLAQFLILRVAFRDSGSAVLDDAIVDIVQGGNNGNDNKAAIVPSIEEFNDAVVEVRMMLLFQMMAGGNETVSFERMIKSLHHITQKMDDIPRKALLACAADDTNAVDYPQFSSLFLNVVAAGGMNFHSVANSMTHTFCRQQEQQQQQANNDIDDDYYYDDMGSTKKMTKRNSNNKNNKKRYFKTDLTDFYIRNGSYEADIV